MPRSRITIGSRRQADQINSTKRHPHGKGGGQAIGQPHQSAVGELVHWGLSQCRHYQRPELSSRVDRVRCMAPFAPFSWFRNRGALMPVAAQRCPPKRLWTKRYAMWSSNWGDPGAKPILPLSSPQRATSPTCHDCCRCCAPRSVRSIGLDAPVEALWAPAAMASASELEQTPALSVTMLSLPGASIATRHLSTEALPDLDGAAQQWQDWVGIHPRGLVAARSS